MNWEPRYVTMKVMKPCGVRELCRVFLSQHHIYGSLDSDCSLHACFDRTQKAARRAPTCESRFKKPGPTA